MDFLAFHETIEFSIDEQSWRQAVSYIWCDQLKTVETIETLGANLCAGDLIVMSGTWKLCRLLLPLKTGEYFGRNYTRWQVLSINTPKQSISDELFYKSVIYKVLPEGERS